MTPDQFRADFPEFSDPEQYPDSLIAFWQTVATSLVNTDRWGTLADLGLELATAHHLALAARDQASVDSGGLPGQMTGPTASKSVDKVSVGYDTAAATLTGAGFWALTRYGVQYVQLGRLNGAGGIQL